MTPEQFQAIKERAEKATAGPWEYDEWLNTVYSGNDSVCQSWYKDETDMPNQSNNVIFIAHARTDVPALLTEVERLQGTLGTAIQTAGILQAIASEKDIEIERLQAEVERLQAKVTHLEAEVLRLASLLPESEQMAVLSARLPGM